MTPAAAQRKMRAAQALMDSPNAGEASAARAAYERLAKKYGVVPASVAGDVRDQDRAAAYRAAAEHELEKEELRHRPRKAGRVPADEQEALADWFFARNRYLDRDKAGRWWLSCDEGMILKSVGWRDVQLLAMACGWGTVRPGEAA